MVMIHDKMNKWIKKEFAIDLEDENLKDSHIGGIGNCEWDSIYKKVLNGISIEEVFKLEFKCINEAKAFYNMYAKVAGYSIQKDDLKWDKNWDIISWKLVCSKKGHRLSKCLQKENRQRELRALTRVGCEATFYIGVSRKLEMWIVIEFNGDHNHPLVDAIDTQFLRSHREVHDPNKAQLDTMHKVGVKTSQIMDYMVQ